jgi:hypothetical protein
MTVAFFCVERNCVVRAWSLWAPAGRPAVVRGAGRFGPDGAPGRPDRGARMARGEDK